MGFFIFAYVAFATINLVICIVTWKDTASAFNRWEHIGIVVIAVLSSFLIWAVWCVQALINKYRSWRAGDE